MDSNDVFVAAHSGVAPRSHFEDVVLVNQPFGVFVAGQRAGVESAVAKLLDVGGAGDRIASSCDVAQVVAATGSTIGALAATSGQ